ncbi:MAG: NAD(P)H-hydrate dehydratase, partial [Planctomycetaceae bacterium]
TMIVLARIITPCVMTAGLPTDADGGFSAGASASIAARVQRAAVVAIGPGIGRSSDVVGIVDALWRDAACPVVDPADALWALARLPRTAWPLHAGPRIVTPHAGEMARLAGHAGDRRAERDWLEQAARHLAHEAAVVVVLKGAGSLVVDGSGEARNETGNPGLATAGTGDVLTGVVAALVAQGLAPFAAARLGAWLHGRAGDVAAQAFGEWSLTARDVIDRLHIAIREAARAGCRPAARGPSGRASVSADRGSRAARPASRPRHRRLARSRAAGPRAA